MPDNDETITASDPIENTGNNTPAADSIEAAAIAAAASEPAPPPAPPVAVPEPEKAPPAKTVAPGKAAATKRKRQTKGHAEEPSASQAHLAAKKAARPPAPPPAPPPILTTEEQAAIDLKVATRARLREVKEEIEALDAQKAALVAEQQELANPVQTATPMSFVERHQQVLARSKEVREQRVRDRLKLLAQGAGRSPLDQSLAGRPRQSMAAADAKAASEKTE